jgi:molybdate transport system regulatory protein
MTQGNIPRLIEALKTQSGEAKKLPCSAAFKIAHDLEVSLAEVGRTCNELDIKIVGCQLGCF